jgi:superoxide dismutase, Cu-Zn family
MTCTRFRSTIGVVGLLFGTAGCNQSTGEVRSDPKDNPQELAAASGADRVAVAAVRGDGDIRGAVVFTEADGKVTLWVTLTGLPPGNHGFHIHEGGECVGDFSSAGGHFNPTAEPHGAPDAPRHHAGDFGNLVANEAGVVAATLEDETITLEESTLSIVGRTVIVHADEDDQISQPAGDAGARIACGVIRLVFDPPGGYGAMLGEADGGEVITTLHSPDRQQ